MAYSTSDPLKQELLFQKALLALFGIGALFVSFMSYTTRSFLDGTLPPAPPSAFAAFASTPGVPPPAGAGVVTPPPPTTGPVGSGGPASIVNDLPVQVTDNFTGGRPTDGGIIGGSQTGSGQNQAGVGGPANASGSSGGSGNSGGNGAGRGTPGQSSGSGSNPSFTSAFPGGQTGGGGGAIGGQTNTPTPPIVVAVPEPNFWVIAILGFAGIGGRMRRERAKGRAASGSGSLTRA